MTMVRELLVAIGVPVVLLVLALQMLARWKQKLPSWLQYLRRSRNRIRISLSCLIIGLVILHRLLQR
jgi:hypothetical protein